MDFISDIFSSNSSDDANNQIVLLNKLMDIIITYAKEYHAKQYDPYIIREKKVINFNANVTLILHHCEVSGLTNFNKISNNTNVKLEGDKKFIIGADLELTHLKIDLNFDAKLGIRGYRYHPTSKTACVSCNRCVFYIEFKVNVRKKFVKANKVTLISNDKIKCKTSGFVWPFNKIVDTLIRKNIEQFVGDNQKVLEDMFRSAVEQFCCPYYSELIKNSDFSKIVKRINF